MKLLELLNDYNATAGNTALSKQGLGIFSIFSGRTNMQILTSFYL